MVGARRCVIGAGDVGVALGALYVVFMSLGLIVLIHCERYFAQDVIRELHGVEVG